MIRDMTKSESETLELLLNLESKDIKWYEKLISCENWDNVKEHFKGMYIGISNKKIYDAKTIDELKELAKKEGIGFNFAGYIERGDAYYMYECVI